MKTDPQRAEQDEEILRLRCSGLSLRAIAARVGLSHQGVSDRITAALAELVTPAAEEYRQLEAARLTDLTTRAYEVLDAADTGELKLRAVDRLTKLSESRRKLLGLDATEPITVALSRRDDAEAGAVVDALLAAVEVLGLDEGQRMAALKTAKWALEGREGPRPEAPGAPAVEEPEVDAEQARREREFRELMARDGVDADELLAGDDEEEDGDV